MTDVLVVDDDDDVREALSGLLEDQGYRVTACADGAEALRLMRERPPGIVLLDFAMPRMGGAALLAERRADPALAAIPVVVVSGGPELPYPAGAPGEVYLRKPVDVDALLDFVRRSLARG